MLALQPELRRRGTFANREDPNLAKLLDLVALGTVADVSCGSAITTVSSCTTVCSD